MERDRTNAIGDIRTAAAAEMQLMILHAESIRDTYRPGDEALCVRLGRVGASSRSESLAAVDVAFALVAMGWDAHLKCMPGCHPVVVLRLDTAPQPKIVEVSEDDADEAVKCDQCKHPASEHTVEGCMRVLYGSRDPHESDDICPCMRRS